MSKIPLRTNQIIIIIKVKNINININNNDLIKVKKLVLCKYILYSLMLKFNIIIYYINLDINYLDILIS